MENAHTRRPDEVLEYFQVTEEKGLTEERAEQKRQKYGRNGTFRGRTSCI
jgi:P-type Ca2+ transporter type 2A